MSIITEKSKPEMQLGEAYTRVYEPEKYLRTIIKSSIDGFTVVDEHGEIEFGNDSFFNIVGWPREELIGRLFIRVFPEECHEFVMGHLRDPEGESGKSYEIKIRTKQGEIRFIYISQSKANIDGRKKYAYIIKDISEKKKLELALKESEKKYRDLFENAVDPMYINNAEGYIQNINRAGLEKLGCSAEEIIGTHVSRWFTPESWELTQDTIRKRVLGEPAEDPMVRQIVTKSGETRWAEIRSRLIKDGDRVVGYQGIARDITDKMELEQKVKDYQKRLEKSLEEIKKSDERYRELYENASDMFLIGNVDGYVLDVNNATVKALGCNTKDEVIGTHFSEWYTPESVKIALNNQKKYINVEPVKQPQILELVCKDGRHKWVEVRSRLIKEGGIAVAIHAIARDITEKLKLEQKLKESEALYRDLFENADDPMYTHDLKGYMLTVNEIGLKMLGGKKEEIIGSHISKWLAPESYKIFEDRVRKIYSNQPLEQPVIIEVINKKGEHKWGEARTRLIKDGNRITGVHGIVRDITEKIRLEMELIESEAKYRDLFENAQDAMYVLDTGLNFLKMNQVGLQILGATKEEVIGSNISKWLTPGSLKIVEERRKKRSRGEVMDKADVIELICKNGESRWVEIKTRPIKNEGSVIEIHGIARDITENMRLKQELKKSNKQRKLLCYLIEGTRGGKTRTIILKHLIDRSYNAHQLAKTLNMDYKTIRHHLDVLIKNGIITKVNDGYTDLYFPSNDMESNLSDLNHR